MVFRFILFLSVLMFSFQRSFSQDQHFETRLPLVFIDTNGKAITDKPKIQAHMGIVWNENGNLNSTRDAFNHYNGKIAIEIRGSSSQSFPKKSYGFETIDGNAEDMDFPLLGFPPEEDWIFYGPYSDKSLIRNALAFTLAKSLGHYSSRVKFIELFVNKKYQGVYLLMEKIKRDSVRVDIANLKPDEIKGPDLTGGYIIKIDKTTGSGGDGWYSKYPNANGTRTRYQYEVPSADEIAEEQKKYIQAYVKAFEDAVHSRRFSGAGSYREYIDVPEFIDYILLSELTRNVDAYRLSTFLTKDKNGKLKAGPVWDFNLSFGNADYFSGWLTTGFQIDARLEGDAFGNPFWWKVMWSDTAFVHAMRDRWDILRGQDWSNVMIMNTTDSLVNLLDDAAERNFKRWPVMGQYVWPNYYVASNYESEINWMKNWISQRLSWLDAQLPGKHGSELPPFPTVLQASLYPNPFRSEIQLTVQSERELTLQFQLFNMNGALMMGQKLNVTEGKQTLEMGAGDLPAGIYLYRLYKGPQLFQQGKLVKL